MKTKITHIWDLRIGHATPIETRFPTILRTPYQYAAAEPQHWFTHLKRLPTKCTHMIPQTPATKYTHMVHQTPATAGGEPLEGMKFCICGASSLNSNHRFDNHCTLDSTSSPRRMRRSVATNITDDKGDTKSMTVMINPVGGMFMEPNVPRLSTQGSSHRVADITWNKQFTSRARFEKGEGDSARVSWAVQVLQSSVWIEKVACFWTMSSSESDALSGTSCSFVGGIEADTEKC